MADALASGFSSVASPGRLALRGRIDEHARLGDLIKTIEPGPLTIDLSEVRYINSLGVRDWVLFLRALADKRVEVTLEHCAEAMVLQMNMILDARGGAHVSSFFAPFACDACGWEGSSLVVTTEVMPIVAAGRTPEADCPECRATTRFADFADRYFLFLGA
jgi:hypothetical protein